MEDEVAILIWRFKKKQWNQLVVTWKLMIQKCLLITEQKNQYTNILGFVTKRLRMNTRVILRN